MRSKFKLRSSLRLARRLAMTGLLALTLGFWPAGSHSRAHAMSPDVKSVLVGGVYGMAIGTGLGLLALPGTRSARGVLMGTSIGLYLGMIAGFYHSKNRDNPENPLRVGLLMDPMDEGSGAGLAVQWSFSGR